MDALIDMLDLKQTDKVLEIGCGWGACAVRAVKVSMKLQAVEAAKQKIFSCREASATGRD